MVTELEMAGLLIATIIGGVISWYLGWRDSNPGEPFDINKVIPSIIRVIIATLGVFGATYLDVLGPITFATYLAAFLAGMAVDSVGNKLGGVVLNT